MRFAVCDDDPAVTGRIDSLIMAMGPRFGYVFEVSVFFSTAEFLKYVAATGEIFDVVLMETDMPGVSGAQAAARLRENSAHDGTLLIFLSDKSDVLKRIIDLHVFCFIPKPIREEEFNLKLSRAIKTVARQRLLPEYRDLVIKNNRREIHIPVGSIMYLESEVRKIHLSTPERQYSYYGILNNEEKRLPAHMFARIHKSYLISFTYVADITAKEVIMRDKRRFSISERHRERVREAYRAHRESTPILLEIT